MSKAGHRWQRETSDMDKCNEPVLAQIRVLEPETVKSLAKSNGHCHHEASGQFMETLIYNELYMEYQYFLYFPLIASIYLLLLKTVFLFTTICKRTLMHVETR